MLLHEQQILRQDRGEPRWGKGGRRDTAAKLSLFVCLEEDSDRRPQNAGAAGTLPRGALGNVFPHCVSACCRQGQASFVEMPGEAQPFMKMLADYVIRVAQFQETISNLVHALLVG